jgi:hypothetical protein
MSDLSPLSGQEQKLDFGAARSVDDPNRHSLIYINQEERRSMSYLAAEPMLELRSMKRQDHEPASSGPEKPRKPSRTEEAQRIVQEYADGLREILKKLRKLFN